MISVTFTVSGNTLTGFHISGHSGYAEEGSDIVCAAVSSASLMAANTITEIQKLDPAVSVNDGFLSLDLSQEEAKAAEVTLGGLRLHLNALSKEYPTFIKVAISEV